MSRGGPDPLGPGRARDACRTPRAARAAALTLLVLLFSGCAYYNTFFQAKKDYARALRLEETSKTDRLSPEAIKCYDQAIERCGKVIVTYQGGWRAGIDDALFLMGQCYYGKREYETAIGKFNEVILNYPESERVPEALFYSGVCYQRLRNNATAAQIFDNLMEQYPKFARADEILFITGEGRETANDLDGALLCYGQILRSFPKSRQREKALLRVGEIHFDAARYDSALAAYEELARTARDDEVYIEAQLRRGACLVRLDRPVEALSIYQRILPENPEREELGGRVWLAMAEAYNRAGRYEEALAKLALVTKSFQNRPAAIEALFMTGYTHEVYLKQYEEAKKAYQQASEDRTRSVFRDQAARRLENLQYLIELQGGAQGAEGDSTATAADDRGERALAALKVAEFSLLESEDTPAALEQYAAVERDFPESEMALRAAYARGWIYYERLDSLDRASEIFRGLIEEHPGSGQAKGALEILKQMEIAPEALAPLDSMVARAQAAERARSDSIAAAAESVRIANEARAAAIADSLAQARAAAAQRPAAAEPQAAAAGADSSRAGEMGKEAGAIIEPGASLPPGKEAEAAPADSSAYREAAPPAPPPDSREAGPEATPADSSARREAGPEEAAPDASASGPPGLPPGTEAAADSSGIVPAGSVSAPDSSAIPGKER